MYVPYECIVQALGSQKGEETGLTSEDSRARGGERGKGILGTVLDGVAEMAAASCWTVRVRVRPATWIIYYNLLYSFRAWEFSFLCLSTLRTVMDDIGWAW